MSLDRFMDGVRKEKKEERGEKRVELVWRRVASASPRSNGGRCPFLRDTWYGTRCVLMSPEDWRRLRNRGNRMSCWEGGRGCRLRARVLGRGWKRWGAGR